MTVTALNSGTIFGGIDTHADTIHVAAIDPWGRELDDKEFATTPAGYRDALGFLAGLGEVAAVGIEGTSSYGTGITRVAREWGLESPMSGVWKCSRSFAPNVPCVVGRASPTRWTLTRPRTRF